MSKIRVMHVVRPAAGGMKNHLLALTGGSDREEFEHMAACPPGSLADSLADRGVRIFCVPLEGDLSPAGDLRATLVLASLFKVHQVDVVHAHSSKAGLVGRLAAKLAGVPAVVFTVHNSIFYEDRPRWKKGLLALSERILAGVTDRIITVSNHLRSEITSRERISPEKIVTIYNGIEPEDFMIAPGGNYLHEIAGIPAGQRIVGTVARLAPQKGVGSFIKAAALVAPDVKDTVFLVVGDGPLRAGLEREAAARGLEGRIFFIGERRDISRIMPCLDLFVLASATEGMPLTVLEAMAACRPVVATRVGGVPEIITDSVNGLLVEPGDVAGLAAAIRKLAGDREMSAVLGKEGRKRVLRDFTVGSMVRRTEQLYRDLVAREVARDARIPAWRG